MSLSSVLPTLVAVLGLANLLPALGLRRRGTDKGARGEDGAEGSGAPPSASGAESGTMAPDGRN
jgi:hypothetical protein